MERRVARDAAQPDQIGLGCTEPVEIGPGDEEYVLGQIVCRGPIADLAKRDAVDHAVILSDEGLKCFRITGLRRFDKYS